MCTSYLCRVQGKLQMIVVVALLDDVGCQELVEEMVAR